MCPSTATPTPAPTPTPTPIPFGIEIEWRGDFELSYYERSDYSRFIPSEWWTPDGSASRYKMVIDMTYSSAIEDPRFYNIRITRDELEDIDIEISVLSPLVEIEDPLDFELGIHGIYIKKGYASGVFLPQVATETGWSKEEFLTNICTHKAGLRADAWKDPDTNVLRFSAEILEEKETSSS